MKIKQVAVSSPAPPHMDKANYSPRVAEPMPTPRVGEAPHLGASNKPLCSCCGVVCYDPVDSQAQAEDAWVLAYHFGTLRCIQ